jgi:hypothetical protein
VPKVDLDKTRTKEENLQSIQEYKDKLNIPDHVLSVKCLSDFSRHPEMNEAMPRTEPPEKMKKFFGPQHSDRGEKMFDIWKTKVEIRIHEPKRGFQAQKKYFLGRIRN